MKKHELDFDYTIDSGMLNLSLQDDDIVYEREYSKQSLYLKIRIPLDADINTIEKMKEGMKVAYASDVKEYYDLKLQKHLEGYEEEIDKFFSRIYSRR